MILLSIFILLFGPHGRGTHYSEESTAALNHHINRWELNRYHFVRQDQFGDYLFYSPYLPPEHLARRTLVICYIKGGVISTRDFPLNKITFDRLSVVLEVGAEKEGWFQLKYSEEWISKNCVLYVVDDVVRLRPSLTSYILPPELNRIGSHSSGVPESSLTLVLVMLCCPIILFVKRFI